ncbi:hypothetical protein C0991_008096 [Blastosporella zonata]|nr:hypothetical protein C0991_008096 [Blastosporella zonata]
MPTGEKPHACPDCPYRTADPGSLTRHKKTQHGYLPDPKRAKTKPLAPKPKRHNAYYNHPTAQVVSTSSATAHYYHGPTAVMPPTSHNIGASDVLRSGLNDPSFSYTWDKLFSSEGVADPLDLESSTPLFMSFGIPPDHDARIHTPFDRDGVSFPAQEHYPQTICPADISLKRPYPGTQRS